MHTSVNGIRIVTMMRSTITLEARVECPLKRSFNHSKKGQETTARIAARRMEVIKGEMTK